MSVVCFVRSGYRYLEVSNDEVQEVKDCDEQINVRYLTRYLSPKSPGPEKSVNEGLDYAGSSEGGR